MVPVSHPRVSSTNVCELNQGNEARSRNNRVDGAKLTVGACRQTRSRTWFSPHFLCLLPAPVGLRPGLSRSCVGSPSVSAAAVLLRCAASTRRLRDAMGAGARPERDGGCADRSRPASSPPFPRSGGSAFASPWHRTWSRGRRWGARGGTRGSVVCLSHYIEDLLVQGRSDYISNR